MNISPLPVVSPVPCSLTRLIEELEQATLPFSLEALTRLMHSAAVTPAEVAPWRGFLPGHYREATIRRRRHYEMRCLCWRPGQFSSIHDHRGSACCVRVVEGKLTTTDYARTAAGLRPRKTFEVPAGELLAREDCDIHRVGNAARRDLITLHVYSPPLQRGRPPRLDRSHA